MPKKTKPSTPSPNPEKPRRNPRGRIKGQGGAFKPTPEQKQLVLQAVGFKIPQEHICQLILHPTTGLPISETTFKLRFKDELIRGAANTKVLHAMALWKNVVAGHVTAQIWWDKTRNKIGAQFGGRDQGEEQQPQVPAIDLEEVDIVVTARRVAFVLAMGAAKAKAKAIEAKPTKPTTSK